MPDPSGQPVSVQTTGPANISTSGPARVTGGEGTSVQFGLQGLWLRLAQFGFAGLVGVLFYLNHLDSRAREKNLTEETRQMHDERREDDRRHQQALDKQRDHDAEQRKKTNSLLREVVKGTDDNRQVLQSIGQSINANTKLTNDALTEGNKIQGETLKVLKAMQEGPR